MDVWEALTHSAEDNGWDLDGDQDPFTGEGFHSVCCLGQHCEKLLISHGLPKANLSLDERQDIILMYSLHVLR